jgi:hypothetical protein
VRESRRVLTRDDKGLPSVAAKKTAWRHKAVSMRQMDYHGKQGASQCAVIPLGVSRSLRSPLYLMQTQCSHHPLRFLPLFRCRRGGSPRADENAKASLLGQERRGLDGPALDNAVQVSKLVSPNVVAADCHFFNVQRPDGHKRKMDSIDNLDWKGGYF